jgi:hypothetical protein
MPVLNEHESAQLHCAFDRLWMARLEFMHDDPFEALSLERRIQIACAAILIDSVGLDLDQI